MIIDFSEVDSLDIAIEDHHRMHVVLRMMFSKGHDFRVALIAPSEPALSQLRESMVVRDLMTGRGAEELPEVQYLGSLDEARAWVVSPATRPEN